MIDGRLLSLVPDAARHIALSTAFQWGALACNVGFVACLCWAAVSLSEGEYSTETAATFGLAAIAAISMRAVLLRASSIQAHRSSEKAKRELRRRIYSKLLELGPAYDEKIKNASLLQVSVEGVSQLESYFGAYLPQLFYSALAPITLFVVLAPVSLPAATVLLVCVPLIPASIAMVQTVAKRLLKDYWGRYETLGDMFLENLQGLVTLKVYQADGAKQAEMDEESERFRKATMRVLGMQLNSITVMDLVAYGGTSVGIVMAVHGVYSGSLGIGEALAVLLLSAEFFLPMRRLGSYFHVAMGGMAAADRIFELLDFQEAEDRGVRLKSGDCAIVAKSLAYSYDGKRPAVSGVDFEVAQGSYVAFVGESGSGKTTIARLLSGQASGYEGSLSAGGCELRSVDRGSLLKEFTVVAHDSHLFAGTVRENLHVADPSASDERLWQTLTEVKLDGLVREMGGLDANVAEGGESLSGGQRQRLAMARAILSEPSVYVFDEACSNVDPESESILSNRMKALAGKSTVVVISHRLASVADADEIFVMQDGRIVERGTHGELLGIGGVYFGMVSAQSRLERWVKDETPEAISEEASCEVGKTSPSGQTVVGEEGGRSASFAVMRRLLALVRPLAPFMVAAIVMGSLGFAASTSILVVGSVGLVGAQAFAPSVLAAVLAACALLRGALRYGEQLCNHFIAFKILSLVRSKVFRKLRCLAPAKMEQRGKGDLVSMITSDVELLEVFYAHTVSPVFIAFAMSFASVAFIACLSPALAAYAACSFVVVGALLPSVISQAGGDNGLRLRNAAGSFSSLYLDSLKGLRETLQFGDGERRARALTSAEAEMAAIDRRMKRQSALFSALTDAVVMALGAGMFLLAAFLCAGGAISFPAALVSTVALMSSFGPVLALANLGSTLQQTVACGKRVLSLLDEKPIVEERLEGASPRSGEIEAGGIGFSYGKTAVLESVSFKADAGAFVCVKGKSGSGKSTLLKLLMRFWDPDAGWVKAGGADLKETKTSSLRQAQSYMTQETHLFTGTLKDNVRIAKLEATDEEIVRACERAGLGDVLKRLPNGLGTRIREGGEGLSGGERQRVGLARAFLHDAPMLILDEPTSNLDALNEARILESIDSLRGEKTVVLVSHRPSTAALADFSVTVERGRES